MNRPVRTRMPGWCGRGAVERPPPMPISRGSLLSITLPHDSDVFIVTFGGGID
jgi:hypothetical protein